MRPICAECRAGKHAKCSGDFSRVTWVTCWCAYCKTWADECGPFAIPRDEEPVS